MAKTYTYAEGQRVPGARAYQVRLHPELAGRTGTVTRVDIPMPDGLPAWRWTGTASAPARCGAPTSRSPPHRRPSHPTRSRPRPGRARAAPRLTEPAEGSFSQSSGP
jgi:hypothetical protein